MVIVIMSSGSAKGTTETNIHMRHPHIQPWWRLTAIVTPVQNRQNIGSPVTTYKVWRCYPTHFFGLLKSVFSNPWRFFVPYELKDLAVERVEKVFWNKEGDAFNEIQ